MDHRMIPMMIGWTNNVKEDNRTVEIVCNNIKKIQLFN